MKANYNYSEQQKKKKTKTKEDVKWDIKITKCEGGEYKNVGISECV